MVPHQVLSRLAEYFHVAWVEPSIPWRESFRISQRKQSSVETSAEVPANFSVCSPEMWLPKFQRPAALGAFTYNMRVRRAWKHLVGKGCTKVILYVWRPEFAGGLSASPFDLSCYHIDDEYSFSNIDAPTDPVEHQLMQAVDQVFIHSAGLLEKKGSINPNTTVSPNGVDYQAYAKPRPEPTDLSAIPRPRIGYTGHLKTQLNWDLLGELAQQRTDWHFVFVGPVSPHEDARKAVRHLSAMANVHFLGAKSVWELATYPQHFDVCIMPYRNDAYTHYIYPLKLHEYLASGQPAVGSRIRSLEDFEDVISLADTAADWVAAISTSLESAENRPARRERRQSVARRHDWDGLVAQIAKTMAGRLGPAYLERLDADIPRVTPEL